MTGSSPEPAAGRGRALLQAVAALAAVGIVIALIIVLPLLVQEETLPAGIAIQRPPYEVSAIHIAADAVWTGGKDGLLLFDRTTAAPLPVPAGAPAFGHVRSIAAGSAGEIWVAHDGGIARYADGRWDTAPGTPPFTRSLAVTAAADGTIYAGTPDGIWRYGGDGWVREVDGDTVGLRDCEALMTDSRGWTWAGFASPTAGGIVVRREGVWERVAPGSLPHPVVRSLAEDASGAVWAATGFASRGGAAVFDGLAVRETYTTTDGLAGGATRTVFEDAAGRMWIASEYDGVAVLFPDGTWQYLDRDTGLAGDEVKAVAEDEDGRLWIGTDLGLTVAEGFERFPLRSTLS